MGVREEQSKNLVCFVGHGVVVGRGKRVDDNNSHTSHLVTHVIEGRGREFDT